MSIKKISVIGLMSGTSLDGLDIVYVQFDKKNHTVFNILFSETKPYTILWKNRLQSGIDTSKEELITLDLDYGYYLADCINEFIKKYKITELDFIASHGHTILHQPNKGITLQVGNGEAISKRTNRKVVCDFRTQDVLLGGQGAPLVPIGDKLLFSQYDSCLNLGGFANISFKKNKERIAFDICPVNIVLNHYVHKLGFEYDDKGKIASEGNINDDLLEHLNNLDFYRMNYPKSLGLEWVQKNIFPLIDSFEMEIKDVLRTFVEHIAIQITRPTVSIKNSLVTGGGVFNQFLLKRIQNYSNLKIIIPSSKIINYKEALIFAFLGLLKVDNQVNCLSNVTGAKQNHSSGVIFYPQKD